MCRHGCSRAWRAGGVSTWPVPVRVACFFHVFSESSLMTSFLLHPRSLAYGCLIAIKVWWNTSRGIHSSKEGVCGLCTALASCLAEGRQARREWDAMTCTVEDVTRSAIAKTTMNTLVEASFVGAAIRMLLGSGMNIGGYVRGRTRQKGTTFKSYVLEHCRSFLGSETTGAPPSQPSLAPSARSSVACRDFVDSLTLSTPYRLVEVANQPNG